jgi:hypothetical protein
VANKGSIYDTVMKIIQDTVWRLRITKVN